MVGRQMHGVIIGRRPPIRQQIEHWKHYITRPVRRMWARHKCALTLFISCRYQASLRSWMDAWSNFWVCKFVASIYLVKSVSSSRTRHKMEICQGKFMSYLHASTRSSDVVFAVLNKWMDYRNVTNLSTCNASISWGNIRGEFTFLDEE